MVIPIKKYSVAFQNVLLNGIIACKKKDSLYSLYIAKEVGYKSILQNVKYSFCWVVKSFVTFIILCLSEFYKFPLRVMHHSCKCTLKNVYLKLNFNPSHTHIQIYIRVLPRKHYTLWNTPISLYQCTQPVYRKCNFQNNEGYPFWLRRFVFSEQPADMGMWEQLLLTTSASDTVRFYVTKGRPV